MPGSKIGLALMRVAGFVNGNSVADSSVYLDGHTLQVDVMGNNETANALQVRRLAPSNNLPTQLMALDKTGALSASLLDSGGQVFNVKAFGTTGTADDSAVFRLAIAAAGVAGGTVYIPAGTYTIGSTLVLPATTAVMFQGAGLNLTNITYSGTGFCFDYQGTNAVIGGGYQGMTITCTAAATGAIKTGSVGQTTFRTEQAWRDLKLIGPGRTVAGTFGAQMYGTAVSIFENVTTQHFETGWLMQETTANVGIRIRFLACKYQLHYARDGAYALETSLDQFFQPEFLGPFGTDGLGYAVKCEADYLRLYEPDFETVTSAADNIKAFYWLTRGPNAAAAPAFCRVVGGSMAVQASTTVATPILIDHANVQNCGFDGLSLGGAGTIGACSVVSVLAAQPTNNLNWAANCNQTLSDALVATGNMMVLGASRTSNGTVNQLGQQLYARQVLLTAPITAGVALLALGSGGFGTGVNQFVAFAQGAEIGINLPVGSTAYFLDAQVAGVQKIYIDSSGNLVAQGQGQFTGSVTAGTSGVFRGNNGGNAYIDAVGASGNVVARSNNGAVTLLTITPTVATFGGEVVTPASTTALAGLNIPHGAAPTAPVNGDIWTTTAGAFIRVNGVTRSINLT